MDISLIIPVYNEERVLKKTLERLHFIVNNEKNSWEIIFVNDGSTDKTLDILKSFKYKFFKIVSYPANQGKGFALKKGIEIASGEKIGFIDSDLAYSFDNLKQAFSKLDNYDIVIGSRPLVEKNEKRVDIPRKILSRGFRITSDLILGYKIKDKQCGLKVFRNKVAKDLFSKQRMRRFSVDAEILFIASKKEYSIKQIPAYLSDEHQYQGSKVNIFIDPIRMFFDLIKIRINYLYGKY